MNDEHRNALQANLHHICQDLDAEDVLPYLCAKGIVREGQAEEILKMTRKSTRNMQLITIVKAAGPLAFQEFINALQFCDKTYLMDMILACLPSSSTQQIPPETIATGFSDTIIHEVLRFRPDSHFSAQQSLKTKYLERFKTVYPFSLPFTFDIENTWVSLALKGYWNYSLETEDHEKLLKKAFEKDANNPQNDIQVLIIEGDPAMGKTSLMRKLAYGWAKREPDLVNYDLVVYGEFRAVREQKFKSIADLVLECSRKYFSDTSSSLNNQSYENLKKLMNNGQFYEKYKVLVLLDGYDESSLEKQCTELNTYLSAKTIDDRPLFNIVITTRKGYLSHLKRRKGRFVFAEVLGFTTDEQKEKYISNHFLSSELDNQKNIAAVHHLLNNNENLDTIAETPLFLTFICLVHERIVDGTLLELYCNIIWWLIDKHQQDFPDRDIPALFGFQNGSVDKFETIQDHYLHFPQLHCLGNMALHHLKENVFKSSHYTQFSLQPVIEQVGLLRNEKTHDSSFKLVTSFFFPHRTIQEYLAAFYCFCSNDSTSEWLLPNLKLNTSEREMNEFDRFLLRTALSDQMPIQAEKRKYYFDRITDINLDTRFDAFNKTAGYNNKLLNWFLSRCTNVQNIQLNGVKNTARHELNTLNDTSMHNGSAIKSKLSIPTLFSFNDLIELHSLTFEECTYETNSQLSFTNCPYLKNLNFIECKISGTNLGIVTLSAAVTVEFSNCIFEDTAQLSFINCPSLKSLIFSGCEMKDSVNLGITTLPAIGTVNFEQCEIDLATWQSITDQIRNSPVKCLKLILGKYFDKETLIHLQNCNNIEKINIKTCNNSISQNDLFSLSDLLKLHTLVLACSFEANSHLSFINCPLLKTLQFSECVFESSTVIGIATLPAVETVEFSGGRIDLTSWQSITSQIRDSSVKNLKLSADFFVKEPFPEFLHLLQQCERIQQIHVTDYYDSEDFILKRDEEEVTANFAQIVKKLPELSCITILAAHDSKLEKRNKERIEEAGRERNPNFLIKYVEKDDSELEECGGLM